MQANGNARCGAQDCAVHGAHLSCVYECHSFFVFPGSFGSIPLCDFASKRAVVLRTGGRVGKGCLLPVPPPFSSLFFCVLSRFF